MQFNLFKVEPSCVGTSRCTREKEEGTPTLYLGWVRPYPVHHSLVTSHRQLRDNSLCSSSKGELTLLVVGGGCRHVLVLSLVQKRVLLKVLSPYVDHSSEVVVSVSGDSEEFGLRRDPSERPKRCALTCVSKEMLDKKFHRCCGCIALWLLLSYRNVHGYNRKIEKTLRNFESRDWEFRSALGFRSSDLLVASFGGRCPMASLCEIATTKGS
ncbi:hypothetical protein PROFUN_05456 [Planoprotostelium fungivorum]|uniref:Uncharacterized protein n=1 Tax=Planoprotostelium fungivorum TaxID=1890364 RepID=A0A2P6NQT1_9EUKA|nr:hypothetical protein PROFUN_05456 [Planoprotostelium fungivorum]